MACFLPSPTARVSFHEKEPPETRVRKGSFAVHDSKASPPAHLRSRGCPLQPSPRAHVPFLRSISHSPACEPLHPLLTPTCRGLERGPLVAENLGSPRDKVTHDLATVLFSHPQGALVECWAQYPQRINRN